MPCYQTFITLLIMQKQCYSKTLVFKLPQVNNADNAKHNFGNNNAQEV